MYKRLYIRIINNTESTPYGVLSISDAIWLWSNNTSYNVEWFSYFDIRIGIAYSGISSVRGYDTLNLYYWTIATV